MILLGSRRKPEPDRPMVRPEMEPIDWLIEASAILGLMIFLGFVIYHFQRLPETIPSHFDGSGKPDGWDDKSTFWALPVIAFFIYFLLTFISLIPNRFNYAVKITPANAMKQYTLAIRLIRYLKAAIIWLFFYISMATVRVALYNGQGLTIWFLPMVLAGI